MSRSRNWIDKIVDANKNSESPARYYWWCSAAAVAAVARKNVYLPRVKGLEVYPNLYVAIVSKDSGGRKAHPINIVVRLLREANCTRVVTGRSSFQALISEMAKQCTLKNGGVIADAQGIIVSSEFDTMFVKDPDALSILTDLYGTHEHDEWKNRLKGSGSETLKNPCISLLIASNERMMESAMREKDREGGFMARTAIVYEAGTTIVNDLIDGDPDMIDDMQFKELANELKEISKIKGEFTWTDNGKDVYRPWYAALRKAKVVDHTGSIHRLSDQALKVAMVLNLAGRKDLKMHGEEMEKAISVCERCMEGVRIVSHAPSTNGNADLSDAQLRILKVLFNVPAGVTMERKKLLQRLWPQVDVYLLERAAESLQLTGTIEIVGPARNASYRITDEGISLLTKFVRESQN